MEAAAYVFKTDLGWIGIASSEKGLRQCVLPQSSSGEVSRILGLKNEPSTEIPLSLADVAERLERYFNGYKTDFLDTLDLSNGTDFQRRVWEITRLIPYGETRSYSWMAEKTGNRNAVRAVGQALGANPLPIIVPCHRVLSKDGSIGGYEGGIELKRYLIWREASAFMRDRSS